MAESEDSRPAIGIDLGTTNCRVGIWLDEGNRFELISNDLGFQTTPSYVSFTETERLIGDAAKEQVCRNPANTVFDAKRLIGRKFSDLGTDVDKMHIQWPFKVTRGKDGGPMVHVEYKGKEKAFSAMDICSMLLGKLKDLAEVHSGSVVNTACVSVPHCFTSVQRMATRSACSLAGFEGVTLVNEPVCAALAYTLQTIGPSLGERKVVIFDLGGGSLDVTLLSIDEGVIEVKATSGDSQLGGEDFDLRLLHHFITEIKEKYERDITSHPRVVRRLKMQVERVKLTLSTETEASLQIESLLEDFTFYSTISRACFEQMNADLFARIMACVQDCLERAALESKDVDEVILVGGSSRIPKVVELLTAFFDASKLNTGINPDEAVVCGAAARAGIARGCGAFADYLVVDALPMSLGLETADGGMHVLHHRYAAVPRSSEQTFTTVHDDQVGVSIRVYEGEHPQACDNVLVATVELSGLTPAPSGVPQILVRFDVDAYGILTVSAKDKTTGEKVEVYMDQDVEIDQDDERRRGLAVQVYHHDFSEVDASESSPLEQSPVDEPSIIITSHPGFSEPVEACESGSELQEMNSKPPPAFNMTESEVEEISEPSPSFEAVESTSQEAPAPSSASESIDKAADISAPPSPSGSHAEMSALPPTFAIEGVESRPEEMSAPPPALESIQASSEEIPEPTSPASPALESSKSMESRSQEFFESSPAFDSSNSMEFRSQEFFEASPVFESSKSVEFLEPSDTMESNSLEFLEPCDTVEENSGDFPAPPPPHESPPPPHEPTIALELPEPQAAEPALVEEILDVVHEVAPISDFRSHKRECATFIRRVNMLVPLFEEVRDLERPSSEETLTCFCSLRAALITAKDLLLLCSKGSKLWLVLEQREVAEKFLFLNTALVQALDSLPDSLGISDEVQEQVDLVQVQLKRSKALEDAVDAQLNAELVSLLGETNESSPDQLRSLAESFKLNTADALEKELDALEGLTKEKAAGLEIPEGFDQIFGLLSALRILFPVDGSVESAPLHSSNNIEGKSQEFSAQSSSNSIDAKSLEHSQVDRDAKIMTQEPSAPPSHSSNSIECRPEEFSAHRSSSDIDDRSLEHSQNEKILAQESSPSPSHSSTIFEGKSQEFPPRSAYSLSNSINGRPSQVDSDERIKPQEHRSLEHSQNEKILAQESSASPSHSSTSFEGKSQEIPPRSPYSSSNSLNGRSSQVDPNERIKPQEHRSLEHSQIEEILAQESSASPSHSSTSFEGKSQEFPPRSPYSSSTSINGRSSQVDSDERIGSQEHRPLEPSQKEKILVQESSAPPSHPSTSFEGKSQEFPPRSPYSSSTSINSRSSQVDSDERIGSQEHRPLEPSQKEKILAQESSAPPSHPSTSFEGKSQEFPPRSAYSSSNSMSGRPSEVDPDERIKPQEHRPLEHSQNEKILAQESSASPSHSSTSFEGKSQEFPPRSAYSSSNSMSGRPPEVDPDERIKPQEHRPLEHSQNEKILAQESSASPSHSSTSFEGKSQEFPPRSPYSSSNSINGRSSQVDPEERIKPQEHSAPPPPLTSTSRSPYSSSNSINGAQVKSFRSSEFSEPLPTHTPERSQEFPEYSSKPEFPEHSPAEKPWNGLEGTPPEPAAAANKLTNSGSTHRSTSFSASSEASSGEFSDLLRGVQNAGPPQDGPELRRAATGVDELHHPPMAESSRSASSPQLGSDSIIEDVVKKYTWGQVLGMTNNLTKSIGKGGFGAVYWGKLDDGKEVAVKILDASSQQGLTEFLNEVNLLKRVNHVYLVRLLGYCLEQKQVLIYEFAEEGSIWDHLQVGGKFLGWKTRLKIALESACGLEYLHTGCHPRIIHRDIKSQNILLTKSMVAKVADFGLSKLGADQDNVSKTHVTTMVKGTLGYLDPEYLKTGQLTEKSDVYSFGVVLLEIITGRKPIQNTDRKGFIGDWVEDHYNANNNSSRHLKHIVDPALGTSYNSKALKLVVNVAKECIHPYGMDRPDMTEVVLVLRKAQMIEHDEKKPSYNKWLPFL